LINILKYNYRGIYQQKFRPVYSANYVSDIFMVHKLSPCVSKLVP
jgi:hypothetical protein